MTKLYHITHLRNLRKIIECGCLKSDRLMADSKGGHVTIGSSKIKRRRLEELTVKCHQGTFVGDYVPFYFCPRSPMLYMIERRSSEVVYDGGQHEVVHLVTSVEAAVETGKRYAYSATNAGARYTVFHRDLSKLDEKLDWASIKATFWGDPGVKEKKQAEFLVHETFPWTSIKGIGTFDKKVSDKVVEILSAVAYAPPVAVRRGWYY